MKRKFLVVVYDVTHLTDPEIGTIRFQAMTNGNRRDAVSAAAIKEVEKRMNDRTCNCSCCDLISDIEAGIDDLKAGA